jgi:hypothetical protein
MTSTRPRTSRRTCFAKLITTIVKYDDRGTPFFAWLLRIARNVAIDHIRANRTLPTEEVFDPELTCGVDLDRPQTVKAALSTAPDEQREVVILRHVVGLTPGEIADRMGRSEGSVHGFIIVAGARSDASLNVSSQPRSRIGGAAAPVGGRPCKSAPPRTAAGTRTCACVHPIGLSLSS